jgi:hypothetical protein
MGTMSASDAVPLPRLGEVFFDVRGDSRTLRLSWYADTGVAVLSIWQGGMCTGTFRLAIADLPRMVETLQRGPERPTQGQRDDQRTGPAQYPAEPAGYVAAPTEYAPAEYAPAEYAPAEYTNSQAQYPATEATGYPAAAAEYSSGPDQYPAGPDQYLDQPGQYPAGPTQYRDEPAAYAAAPTEYATGPAQYPAAVPPEATQQWEPFRPGAEDYQPGAAQYPAEAAQYLAESAGYHAEYMSGPSGRSRRQSAPGPGGYQERVADSSRYPRTVAPADYLDEMRLGEYSTGTSAPRSAESAPRRRESVTRPGGDLDRTTADYPQHYGAVTEDTRAARDDLPEESLPYDSPSANRVSPSRHARPGVPFR